MSDQFLAGKSAVVTGGTRGIGKAIAAALLQAGAKVAVCGRSAELVASVGRELSAHGPVFSTVCDVANEESVRELFQFAERSLGTLDILVNNAGLGIFKPVAELQPAEWRQTIDVNLTGVYYCCHYALPLLRARPEGGTIINISSLAGKNPFAGGAAYNASKFGLNGFGEALMLDHRNDNIKVSTIMPGSVNTEFGRGQANATWKIQPEDLAQITLDLLRLPARTLVSRVEVRPAKPSKG